MNMIQLYGYYKKKRWLSSTKTVILNDYRRDVDRWVEDVISIFQHNVRLTQWKWKHFSESGHRSCRYREQAGACSGTFDNYSKRTRITTLDYNNLTTITQIKENRPTQILFGRIYFQMFVWYTLLRVHFEITAQAMRIERTIS